MDGRFRERTIMRTIGLLALLLAGAASAQPQQEPAPDGAAVEFFEKRIRPVLAERCYSCHSAEQKVKGKYRMEEYDLLVKGGSEGDGIVHGQSKDSNVIIRIDLPTDDDEHMPPEDKTQLEPHEITLIRWWIDSGASKDAKLSDLKPSDEIKSAISKLVPAEQLAEQKAAKEDAAKLEEKKEGPKG